MYVRGEWKNDLIEFVMDNEMSNVDWVELIHIVMMKTVVEVEDCYMHEVDQSWRKGRRALVARLMIVVALGCCRVECGSNKDQAETLMVSAHGGYWPVAAAE
ncbi:hypothetical protein Tco_0529875 [Tanacetum coccineum]